LIRKSQLPKKEVHDTGLQIRGPNLWIETLWTKHVLQERSCKVERKWKERYSQKFRRRAVARMNACDNIVRLLRGSYLQADETPVGVQMHDGNGSNHLAYLWQYGRPHGAVVFDFRMGRGKPHA